MGSLLEGLTSQERSEIYNLVFIAHSNPTSHPAFGENWLFGLADHILTYEFADDSMQRHKIWKLKGIC
jgi:hypothetical protein